MVVSSVRRPASRCRGSWRPPTGARCTFGKPELAAGGNCSELEKLQLDWPEAALPRCAGVMVVPSLRRPASRCRGTLRPPMLSCICTPARRIPRRPSNLTSVAVPHSKRKHLLHHISSTTISTKLSCTCALATHQCEHWKSAMHSCRKPHHREDWARPAICGNILRVVSPYCKAARPIERQLRSEVSQA